MYPEESYKIIGACFEVYNEMGHGFLENVYQECLAIEFARQGIPFSEQMVLPLDFRGERLKQTFKADFVCYERIIVEIKATSQIVDDHRSRVLNYLNATKFRLGLVVNFGHYPGLEHERIVL